MSRLDYIQTSREDAGRIPAKETAAFKKRMGRYSRLNVWIYRLSRGYLMNTAMGGYPICIIAFTGVKTGRKRRIPLIHVPDQDDILLVGSQAGLDRDPIWVGSLRADPEIAITFSGRTHAYRAQELSPSDKREVWPHLCSVYPAYDAYQARTDRDIPVFRASRIR